MTGSSQPASSTQLSASAEAARVTSGVNEPAPALELWSQSLAHEFDMLAGSLLAGTTVAEVLRGIVAAGAALVPDADLVSITMREPSGHYTTPLRSGALAEQLDQLQYIHKEGPCVDATQTPGPGIVEVADLDNTALWPLWAPAAADLGVRSVLAVGLAPAGRSARLGALNFYAFHADKLNGLDRDMVVLLASHATVALAATNAITAAELEAAHLRTALTTRDVIGQAKGILMQRRGISSDEAFDILRRASQQLNIKLAAVAQLLASRHADLLEP